MEFTIAAVISLILQTRDVSNEMRYDYEKMHKCIVEKTCTLTQKDGYLQLDMIEGATPVVNKYSCVREGKCTAYWIKKQVVIVPKES